MVAATLFRSDAEATKGMSEGSEDTQTMRTGRAAPRAAQLLGLCEKVLRATPDRRILGLMKRRRPSERQQENVFRRHVRTRPWATLPQLRQATLEFIDDLKSTLKISYSDDDGRVSGPYTSQVDLQAITEIHSRITRYFPRSDGSYKRLLVDAEAGGGAGIYLGPRTPQSVRAHIARHSLYCQKIWIPNPFCQLYVSGSDGNPLPNGQEAPHHWMNFTIRNAIFLSMLRPWIEENIVICAPAMGWADEDFFREKLVPSAAEKMSSQLEGLGPGEKIEMLDEIISQVHPRLIPDIIRKTFGNDVPADVLMNITKIAESQGRFNSFDDTRGAREVMLVTGQGETMESADAVSRLVGGYTLPTGLRYERIYQAERAGQGGQRHQWTDVSLALADYRFNFLNEASLEFALKIRKEGRFEKLRYYLNKTWHNVLATPGSQSDIKELRYELSHGYDEYREEWDRVERRMVQQPVVTGALTFATGAFTLGLSAGLVTALTTSILSAMMTHYDRKKVRSEPLSVFADLDKS